MNMLRCQCDNTSCSIQNCSIQNFKEILSLEIHTVDYKPIKGSSHIPLPDNLSKRKVMINLENKNDQKCFLWSILIHPVKINFVRLTDLKKYENDLNFNDISFPAKIRHQKFWVAKSKSTWNKCIFNWWKKKYIYIYIYIRLDSLK